MTAKLRDPHKRVKNERENSKVRKNFHFFFQPLEESCKKHLMIYHYTTIHNLALILNSGKIRFSRLDTLIDSTEIELLGDVTPMCYFFVSCWEKSGIENPALWHMYSDKIHGVRIGLKDNPFASTEMVFPSSCGIKTEGVLFYPLTFEQMQSPNFFIFPTFGESFCNEIEYTENYVAERKRHFLITDNDSSKTQNLEMSFKKLPRIKNKIWSFENELRFSLFILPPYDKKPDTPEFGNNMHHHLAESLREKRLPSIPYFDLALDNDVLNSIEITLAPRAETSDELIVRSLVNTYTSNGTIKPSSLHLGK